VTRVQALNGVLYPVVTQSTPNGGGTFIRWTPIFAAAKENDLRTDSAYLNDSVSFGSRWQFSLGARLDRNHAVDGDGTRISNHSRISPRISGQFDVRGDARHRLSASYAQYTSRIADAIASSGQSAGNAAAIDFVYRGPGINDKALTTPTADVIRMVFDYFNTVQSGTANLSPSNLRPNGSRVIPGYSVYFDGTLSSPYVEEWTAGYGLSLGGHGYVRADAIWRDWHDFYAASVTPDTRKVNTPLGIPVDLALIRNSDAIQRHYRGIQVQAHWSLSRLATGAHYTWSTLRGNDEGEGANGALTNIDPSLYYPEYTSYERAAPLGDLAGGQRHRLRAWAGYELDLRRARVGFTLLHNYDSSLSYSIVAPISLTGYAGAPSNPGYKSIPSGRYFFSGRGALRTEGIHATDLAVRTAMKLAGLDWFAQADLLNIFNRAGVADPNRLNTSVATAATSSTFAPFDPRTATPVECPRGAPAATCTAMHANYQLAPAFGEPLNNLAYQTPRTIRVSLGIRF
jgi:hypothetical protein